MISLLRTFLERNKIFFEVIVAFCLSFMAIYVSIQANKIAENQTRIMEEENLPQLEIRMKQEFNSSAHIYDNNVWLLFNRDGSLSNLLVEKMSFIRFSKKIMNKWDLIEIPIDGYFAMRGTLNNETEGLIYEIDNNHNGNKEINLRNALLNTGFIDLGNYFAISYVDIFNKTHSMFFQISPGINEIDETEWSRLKSVYDTDNHHFYFPKLNINDIKKVYDESN